MIEEFLRREEAAQYLQHTYRLHTTTKTLTKLACTGGGPVYQKFGRMPLYKTAWLDEWVAANLSGPVTQSSQLNKAG